LRLFEILGASSWRGEGKEEEGEGRLCSNWFAMDQRLFRDSFRGFFQDSTTVGRE